MTEKIWKLEEFNDNSIFIQDLEENIENSNKEYNLIEIDDFENDPLIKE
jgi:hypothetical protein